MVRIRAVLSAVVQALALHLFQPSYLEKNYGTLNKASFAMH